jgi:lysophospholipase L1-like esterase
MPNLIFSQIANTSYGAAGTDTGVTSGWIDVLGGTARIQSGELVLTEKAGVDWSTSHIQRPNSPTSVYQKISALITLKSDAQANIFLVRKKDSDNFMFIGITKTFIKFLKYKNQGVVLNQDIACNLQLNTDYRVEITAQNSSLKTSINDLNNTVNLFENINPSILSDLLDSSIVALSTWTVDGSKTPAYYKELDYSYTPESVPITTNIVCDGNSLTFGFGGINVNYPARLQTLLGSSYQVTNIGVSGQTTQQMISDFASQVIPLKNNSPGVENILIAWEIGNDIYVNNISGQQAYENFKTYCKLGKVAGYKVVAITSTTRAGYSGNPPNFEANRKAANQLIRDNWLTFCDTVIDLTAHPSLNNSSDTTYFTDLVHFTDAGYTLIADLICCGISQLKLSKNLWGSFGGIFY